MALSKDTEIVIGSSAGEAGHPEWEEEIKRLKRLVYEDEMTGLPNFRQFRKDFRCRLETGKPFLVGYVDVDQFKQVNDRYGHEMGDRILRQSGWRMIEAIGELANVYRKGGDEFLLLSGQAERVGQLSAELESAFQKPFRLDEHELRVCISIGFSIYPDHSLEERELLHLADVRMYAAKHKRTGNGTFTSSRERTLANGCENRSKE